MSQTEAAVLEISQLLALALAAVALATVLIGLAVHRKSKRLRFRRVSSDRRLVRDTWQRNAPLVADLIQARNYAELEAMVKAGQADPNQRRDEPGGMSSPMLVDAVGNGEVKLAQALIDHPSIDCNLSREDGTTPLIMAASRGHETLVDSLLKLPSLDLNARNSNQSTALIVSARPGHATIVRMLLGAGVDRTCAQYRGLTALHFACRDGHLEIAQYLLSNCDKETIRQMLEARDENGFTPLMYSCQRDHHTVAQLLLNNMDGVISSSSDHGTALHVAATHDSSKTMRLLVESGKLDPKATDSRGRTALDVAEVHGSHSCAQILSANLNGTPSCDSSKICKLYQFELLVNEQAVQLSSEEFSLKLHRAMLDSGYSSHRAVFQAGAADLLAELGNISELRDRFDKRKASGSFADGWGSSLQRLNGSVASSSDVDMSVQQKNQVHVEGSCKCLGAPTYRLEEGFLRLPDVCGDKPSRTDIGVGVRPSMDFCSFRPSCCIPIELRTSLSKLPKRFEFPANPEVEFVRSVRPECTDVMEMRISCTSLEKAILRQLSTCQGQVFVLVKYIFKQVLAAKGLKSYHSKTLMFYLVCEIPEEQWTADRLEWLVVAALHRFEQFVIESEEYGASNCMPHFFIRDAWVYFKTGSATDRRALIRCMQAAQRDVRSILASYMSEQLRPLRLGSESPFVFQPFSLIELVTPFKRPKKLESGQLARYQDIYPMLFKILADIGNPRCTGERCEDLSRDIDSLPERAAATVRAVLRVLLHLKLGSLSSARQVLKDSEGIQAKRSIDFQHPQSVDDAKRIVLHQLETSNCAWKFCFYFNEKLDFRFLSDHVTSKLDDSAFGFYQLPGHLLLDFAYFVNFDAALKVLSMCLIPERSAELVSQWYSELCSEEDSEDIYELYLFAKFSRDAEQLKHCLLRMRSLSIKMDKELDMIEEVEKRLKLKRG